MCPKNKPNISGIKHIRIICNHKKNKIHQLAIMWWHCKESSIISDKSEDVEQILYNFTHLWNTESLSNGMYCTEQWQTLDLELQNQAMERENRN